MDTQVQPLLKNTIATNLLLLVIIVVAPAMSILLFTGFEQRQSAIKSAEDELQLICHAMAEAQKSVAQSTRHLLSALITYHEIKEFDPQKNHFIKNMA